MIIENFIIKSGKIELQPKKHKNKGIERQKTIERKNSNCTKLKP